MSSSTDPIMQLLVEFVERFEKEGHDIAIDVLQTETPGESQLRCVTCKETVTIEIRETSNWTMLARTLDDLCKVRRTDHG